MAITDIFRRRKQPKRRPSTRRQSIRERVSELISRVATNFTANIKYYARVTVDYTQADYEYYDKLRRGLQYGFEISGLFTRPITQIITSWTLGDSFTVDIDNQNTSEAVNDFINNELQAIVETSEDMLALGDSYIVVNPDGTLTQVPPSQVDIEVSDDNFRNVTKATIYTRHKNLQIEDSYTNTERTITVRRTGLFSASGSVIEETVYPNLIGRIPVIHFPNDRGSNEVYGHPYYAEQLTLLAEYDDVIRKSIDGVKMMGNPIPVVEGLDDPESAKELNSTYTDTYVDLEGNTQTEYVTELDPHNMLYFGAGARFKFAAPGSFTDNTNTVLKKLFLLMLQNSQIPEWAWGGAIQSSMASVQAQTPAFVKFIGGRRRKLETPLKALLEVYIATIAIFTPGIDANAVIHITWPELMPEDEEIRLKWVMFAMQNNMITRETALRLADIVENPRQEIEDANEEAQAQEDAFQAQIDAAINTLANQNDIEDNMPDDVVTANNGNGNRQLQMANAA